PGQDRRLEEEGDVDGRHGTYWVRRGRAPPGGQPGRGRNRQGDLRALSRTRLDSSPEAGSRPPQHHLQDPCIEGGNPIRRTIILTRGTPRTALQPDLRGRDPPPQRPPSWSARVDCRPRVVGQGSAAAV